MDIYDLWRAETKLKRRMPYADSRGAALLAQIGKSSSPAVEEAPTATEVPEAPYDETVPEVYTPRPRPAEIPAVEDVSGGKRLPVLPGSTKRGPLASSLKSTPTGVQLELIEPEEAKAGVGWWNKFNTAMKSPTVGRGIADALGTLAYLSAAHDSRDPRFALEAVERAKIQSQQASHSKAMQALAGSLGDEKIASALKTPEFSNLTPDMQERVLGDYLKLRELDREQTMRTEQLANLQSEQKTREGHLTLAEKNQKAEEKLRTLQEEHIIAQTNRINNPLEKTLTPYQQRELEESDLAALHIPEATKNAYARRLAELSPEARKSAEGMAELGFIMRGEKFKDRDQFGTTKTRFSNMINDLSIPTLEKIQKAKDTPLWAQALVHRVLATKLGGEQPNQPGVDGQVTQSEGSLNETIKTAQGRTTTKGELLNLIKSSGRTGPEAVKAWTEVTTLPPDPAIRELLERTK